MSTQPKSRIHAQPLSTPQSGQSAQDVLRWLTPDLKTTLASLHGAPQPVAQAVVQLLPFGSRVALEGLGVAVAPAGAQSDRDAPRILELTPFALEVMAAAADEVDADPDAVEDWSERARLAAQLDETGDH